MSYAFYSQIFEYVCNILNVQIFIGSSLKKDFHNSILRSFKFYTEVKILALTKSKNIPSSSKHNQYSIKMMKKWPKYLQIYGSKKPIIQKISKDISQED